LIRNVLFESQIDYKFVTGDISTFLRYKYYARNFTYKIAVFDSIGFSGVQSSSLDFDRVRGGLLLFELPRNYNERYFLLFQDDRLTFGNSADADNRKNNIYTKVAYQYGTPFDARMNVLRRLLEHGPVRELGAEQVFEFEFTGRQNRRLCAGCRYGRRHG